MYNIPENGIIYFFIIHIYKQFRNVSIVTEILDQPGVFDPIYIKNSSGSNLSFRPDSTAWFTFNTETAVS
jgi:hypothetical protein